MTWRDAPATPNQMARLLSDVKKKMNTLMGDHPETASSIQRLQAEPQYATKGYVSDLIDTLSNIPDDPDPSIPDMVSRSHRYGVNRYENDCYACGFGVPAGQGFYFYPSGSKAKTHHKVGECLTEDSAGPSITVERGVYIVDDATIVIFQARNGRGEEYLYARQWTGTNFSKFAGGIKRVSRHGRVATAEEIGKLAAEAGAQGIATARCMFCSRGLEESSSKDLGYGPVCAKNYGLPHGQHGSDARERLHAAVVAMEAN